SLTCESCGEPVCKACVFFLEPDTFSFLRQLPAELKHSRYCPSCQAAHIAPALEAYEEKLERAREVYFFFVTQRKAIPLLRRSKEKLSVEDCGDRDETILRLAFQAVELGCNAVIEAEVLSEKVRNAGYQTSRWHGTGFPAEVDVARMERL
ncbi:MAG: hypothetical protein NDJ90_11895, partial [Oligoflexia bacterium]|nr:hypothetical protein [Oligoflexia bacterium]